VRSTPLIIDGNVCFLSQQEETNTSRISADYSGYSLLVPSPSGPENLVINGRILDDIGSSFLQSAEDPRVLERGVVS